MWNPSLEVDMRRLSHAGAAVAAVVLLTGCSDTIAPEPIDLIDFIDAQHDVVVEQDIVYATGDVRLPSPGQRDLLLDLYRPATPGTPSVRPGIVLAHGGGFTSGSKTSPSVTELGRRFAARGYVAVSINYRLTGDDPPTEDLATNPSDPVSVAAAAARVDAALAVEWLRDHAADYDVDPDRIAIAGYSAGAIAALGVAYWEPGVQHADVRAVFSLSGGLYGREGEIDAGEPPLLLVHGELDTARAPHEAVAGRAAAVGLTYQMHVIPGVGHDTPQALDNAMGSTTAWEVVVEFLYEHLDLVSLP